MAKVLMLDDDAEALAWTSAALTSAGHEVRAFASARAALAALPAFEPDLVVSDMLMPELDGLAFARLARRHRAVPVIFVSVAKKEAEAVLVGAIGYVRKPASAQEIRQAVDRVLRDPTRPSTVLVVDDDADVRALYTAFLGGHFETLTAANGKEALEALRARHVDLVVVDVHMPVMNGAELVRAMRNDPALDAVPVIVQTSDPTAAQAPVWATLRVSQVMDKPRFAEWLDAYLPPASPPPREVHREGAPPR